MRAFLSVLAALSLCIAAILFVDWRAMWDRFHAAEAPLLFGSLALHAMGLVVLQALRLGAVVPSRLGFRESLRITLVAQFFTQFLPSAIGGDAVRAAMLNRSHGFDWKKAIGATACYRLSGISTIALLGLGYAALQIGRLADVFGSLSESHLAIGIGSIVAVILMVVLLALHREARQRMFGMVRPFLDPAFGLQRSDWIRIYLFAGGFHLTRAGCFCLYLRAFGLDYPDFGEALFVLAVAAFSGLLPVAFGGLGVVEGAIAGGLVAFGTPPTIAIGVALMNRLAILLSGLAGAWPFWSLLKDGGRPFSSTLTRDRGRS